MALSFPRFASASFAWRNLSTQIGANAATTALSDCSRTISAALPPVTQPPNANPTKARAAAPPAAPQRTASIFGDNFKEKFMTCPFARRVSVRVLRKPGWAPVMQIERKARSPCVATAARSALVCARRPRGVCTKLTTSEGHDGLMPGTIKCGSLARHPGVG